MPTADVNGITLNYTLTGPTTAPSLILINGLADDLTTWSAQTPAFLSAGYQVVAFDNRGIGASSRPPGPYTAELLADDLHALLKFLDVKEAYFLGVSMGGMILQSYMLRYPNGSARAQGVEMKGAVLGCTYAAPGEFCSRMFSLWEDMARRMSVRDVMRHVTLWAFTVPFFRTRGDEVREVEQAMEALDMPLEAYLAQLNVIQKFDSMSALEGLRANEQSLGNLETRRVMVLAGKVDILIPVTLSMEFSQKIEGSVFRTVKGGHACMWEFPDSFNEAVIDHLNQCKT